MKLLRLAALGLLVVSPLACTDESVEALERVRLHTAETLDALRDLGATQKEEFVKRSEDYLRTLDERIETLKETGGEEALERLKQLRDRRDALGVRLGELREASGDAWAELSEGFVGAIEEIRRSDEGR